MKYLNIYLSLFLASLLLLAGCGDTSEYLTTKSLAENIEKGGLVRFADLNGFPSNYLFSDFPNFNETRTVYDPNGNLSSVSYDVEVSFGDSLYTAQNVISSSTFPFDINITQSIVEGWVGLPAGSFQNGGNFFNLSATATRNDGTEFTVANTNDVLVADSRGGYVHAMEFGIILGCPFKAEEAEGQYLIVNDPFGTTLAPDRLISVVVDAGAKEVTFIDLFSHPNPEDPDATYDVTVKYTNAQAGLVEVERQPAWHCDNFGCPYGEGRVDGTGLFLTCIGQLNVNLQHTVDLGSFGTYNLQLQKQ